MNIAYRCKFCDRPGITQCDDDAEKMIDVSKWLPMLCCNRCGDFMVAKRKTQDAIFVVCRIIEVARINPDSAKRSDVERVCFEKLVELTKRFASTTCNYYRLQNVWEKDFAQAIFEKPTRAGIALTTYLRQLARESRKQTA